MGLLISGATYSTMENLMKMDPGSETTFMFSWFRQLPLTVVNFVTNSYNLRRKINYLLDLCLSDLTLSGTIGTCTTYTTKNIYFLKVNLENTIIKIKIWSDQTTLTIGTLFTELTEQELILLVMLLELLNQALLSRNSSQPILSRYYKLGQHSLFFNKLLPSKGWNVLDVQITSQLTR